MCLAIDIQNGHMYNFYNKGICLLELTLNSDLFKGLVREHVKKDQALIPAFIYLLLLITHLTPTKWDRQTPPFSKTLTIR